MSENTYNLLGTMKQTILCRTETKCAVVMRPLSEKEEKAIDKSEELFGCFQYNTPEGHVIDGKSIYVYGEVDINNDNDLDLIERFDLVDKNYKSFIYSNFDYEKGTFTTIDGISKFYPTTDCILWFKYNYCLIGKPKRIIVYKDASIRKKYND